jgi:predicted O-methyltransferase YrrM
MRRNSRALARAGRDQRAPEELLLGAPDGTVSGFESQALIDPRHQLGSMAPVQVREELLSLLDRVRQLRPARLCEIGAAGGGTLYMFTRVAPPGALIISMDIEIPAHTARARARMGRDGQQLANVEADSHADATLDRLRDWLAGEPLDFLVIDGDHSYEGVRRDFELYAPLVREGGLIALHDINPDRRGEGSTAGAIAGEVPRFWQELRETHRTEELIADPSREGYGIGLVFP